MGKPAKLDCMSCGACCCSPDVNRARGIAQWVAVVAGEPLLERARLVRRFVDLGAHVGSDGAAVAHMRMDKDFRCTALRGTVGRSVECGLYELRPGPCRRFAAGSETCLALRRERGIDAPAAR